MAKSFELIASTTVGAGGSASMVFSSIPQTYSDLLIKITGRGSQGQIYDYPFLLRFNGATNDTNLSSRGMEGNGSTAVSYSNPFLYLNAANGGNSTANVFSSHDVYIPNYTSTTTYKSVSVEGTLENNATTAYYSMQAGLWSSNSAITEVIIIDTGGNLVQHSSASLYGIKKN